MREILFRGKTFDGEWEEGSLHIEYGETTADGKRNLDYRILGMRGECRYVDPETIGQYTGLCDKNGRKIFEGDICRVGHLLYMVEFNYSQWKFSILSAKVLCYPAFNSHCGERCIIIGNVHDNPELLEGEG